MKAIRVLPLLFALACAAPPPVVVPAAPAAPAGKVVLVSFDGLGWEELQKMRAAGVTTAEGWEGIASGGFTARMIPVSPTLTSVTHISMATGAVPDETGIVSNSFHMPGEPVAEWASGFEVPIEAETIWEAAQRAGKRVGAITYPGLDAVGPQRTADWGLIYTQPVSRSRIQVLERDAFNASGYIPDEASFSPVLAATLAWEWSFQDAKISDPVELLAFDSTNDGERNYDRFAVRHRDRVRPIGPDRWFSVSAELEEGGSPHLFGAWSKILDADPELETVRIYWGTVSRTKGYPESFRRMIDREAGFWPGPPDDWASGQWRAKREGIDPATYVEQLRRFSDFFTRATELAMERMPYDLLLAYQPIVDEAEHAWRLVNERQLQFTPENAAAGEMVRKEAFRAFDRAVARLRAAVDPDEALLVVSDHGLEALDTTVRLNRLLVDWGYAQAEGNRLSSDTRWASYTSGNLAHIYRFREGAPGEAEAIAEKLRALRAPDGEPVFEKVELRSATHHPRAGDVIGWMFPRFAFSSSLGGEAFEKSNYYGQHGALNHHENLHATLGAIGAGIAQRSEPRVSQLSIAPWIASLLGFDPPRGALQK